MASKKHNKPVKKPKSPIYYLTVCGDCRIRLVVRKEKANRCDLCKSINIVTEPWK